MAEPTQLFESEYPLRAFRGDIKEEGGNWWLIYENISMK